MHGPYIVPRQRPPDPLRQPSNALQGFLHFERDDFVGHLASTAKRGSVQANIIAALARCSRTSRHPRSGVSVDAGCEPVYFESEGFFRGRIRNTFLFYILTVV